MSPPRRPTPVVDLSDTDRKLKAISEGIGEGIGESMAEALTEPHGHGPQYGCWGDPNGPGHKIENRIAELESKAARYGGAIAILLLLATILSPWINSKISGHPAVPAAQAAQR